MPTTFANACAQRTPYAVPFVPTRIQKPIYIYDVSRLDDTATGYAGLEPAGTRSNKWRSEGKGERWERSKAMKSGEATRATQR